MNLGWDLAYNLRSKYDKLLLPSLFPEPEQKLDMEATLVAVNAQTMDNVGGLLPKPSDYSPYHHPPPQLQYQEFIAGVTNYSHLIQDKVLAEVSDFEPKCLLQAA